MLAFRENENDVMIYSPSCHSKALYLLFIQRKKNKKKVSALFVQAEQS